MEICNRALVHLDFGDVPTWLAAVGTLGTLAAALWQIRIERRSREKLEEQKQAIQIATWINRGTSSQLTEVTIRNASGSPIYDVVVTVVIASGAGPRTGEEVAELPGQKVSGAPSMRRASSMVPPGKFMMELPAAWGGMNRKPGIEIAFTDFQGKHWVRRYNGQLESLRNNALQTMLYPLPFGDFLLRR